ncbi:hypothetical protein [Hymenobacter jeollabukensis]|jgi:hypothetical protein|uniref:Uncharacterized protein n=1 Tax=Hymenobacter jeollabukensis TaxID=2025313 RepID=A0A5R8WNN9_9BACT|nr:hypothetical protein [Hymenobacter jeollabukensis]TLM91649.1 hypothetical protein FDY95_13885 [Hymenobacter jeollabukensis]
MLQLMTSKRIGRRQFHFTVQGGSFHEVVAEYDRLSFPDVAACGLCGSDNLDLTSRVAQDKFKYTSVKCLDCRGDLTFGKMQRDDQTVFLRRRESGELDWQAWKKGE